MLLFVILVVVVVTLLVVAVNLVAVAALDAAALVAGTVILLEVGIGLDALVVMAVLVATDVGGLRVVTAVVAGLVVAVVVVVVLSSGCSSLQGNRNACITSTIADTHASSSIHSEVVMDEVRGFLLVVETRRQNNLFSLTTK